MSFDPIKRLLLILFRILSYGALAVILVAAALLALIGAGNVCPEFNEGRVACISPFWQSAAEFSMGVAIAAAFTGIPLILGLAGAVFAVRDLRSWIRKGREIRSK
ncbi:hypothetical protein [Terrarubrum flagellatum]|uniref:hypothetical protein n=1 Tax=Terrirubrum flagellatum TaxID=2895980 RepID=UPI0031450FEB